jgi:TolA-binding protein
MFHLISALLAMPAFGSVTDDLDRATRSADELTARANDLDHRIAPGRAFLNQTDAIQAYEENLLALVLKQYRTAAEGFYALVSTGALRDANRHREAEWYLAEALFGMDNLVTAQSMYEATAEQSDHPFREEAVRRLLELYAVTDQDDAFKLLYEAEIVRGRVEASGVVTYTIGKSFYTRGEMDRARGYFQDVLLGDPYYSRAQYFLGVMALRDGAADTAVPFFEAAAEAPVIDTATRQVQDLALLAVARIAYEQSDFDRATEYYQRISGDSAYLADVLREQVWSAIKQERYDNALRGADLFLLAFPEHQYTGELRVVRGHLYMGCGQTPERCPDPDLPIGEGDAYERALYAYEAIVADYTPIQERFAALANSQDEPAEYFRQVFAAGASDAEGLPQFAVSMMRSDTELDAALTVYERLQEQRADLADSEAIVAELQALLSGPTSVGGYDASRYQAVVNQARAIREQVELLDLEAAWLEEEEVSGLDRFDAEMSAIQVLSEDAEERIKSSRKAQTGRDDAVKRVRREIEETESLVADATLDIETLRRKLAAPNDLDALEREAVEVDIADVEAILSDTTARLGELRVRLSQIRMPTADAEVGRGATTSTDELETAIADLREDYKRVRPAKSREIADRFDALHEQLADAADTYARVLDRIETLADSEVARVREQFAVEVENVRAQRAELDATSARTETLAVDLTRKGFGRMDDFFQDSVLKAEMGIIDVYWARKLELADQRERIQDERNMLVAELERRFAIIRQKMEQ